MKAKMVAPPPAESTVVLEMTETEAGALMGLLGKFVVNGSDEPFGEALVDTYDALVDAGVRGAFCRVLTGPGATYTVVKA